MSFDPPIEAPVVDMDECPGDGQCHGCLQWCRFCGDVDLMCDFPECDSHPRIEAVRRDRDGCRKEVRKLESELKVAQRCLEEAEEKLRRYERGPYRMTTQSRKDLVREVLDA